MSASGGVSETSKKLLLLCILVLAVAGACAAGELLKQHDNIWNMSADRSGFWGQICTAGRDLGFDCAAVKNDRWGEIRMPVPTLSNGFAITLHMVAVPVAFFGLAYFVFVAAWLAQAGTCPSSERWHRLSVHIGRFGALISLFYMGLMVFGVSRACLGCYLTHGINLLMVLAIERFCRRREPDNLAGIPEGASSVRIAALTLTNGDAIRVIATALVCIGGPWMYRREHLAFRDELANLTPYKKLVLRLREDPEFLLREYNAQPRLEIPSRSYDASCRRLPELVIFSDYQCPSCSCATRETQEQIAGAFPKGLLVRVRHYPLCRECNTRVKRTLHAAACEAAYAAEAARRVGGDEAFEKMHRLLVENHQRLSRPLFVELAARVGLDPRRFLQEFDSEPVRRVVAEDIDLAARLGVTGTPAMFLDGRRVPELCRTPIFWNAVAERLAQSSEDETGTTAASTGADGLYGE